MRLPSPPLASDEIASNTQHAFVVIENTVLPLKSIHCSPIPSHSSLPEHATLPQYIYIYIIIFRYVPLKIGRKIISLVETNESDYNPFSFILLFLFFSLSLLLYLFNSSLTILLIPF